MWTCLVQVRVMQVVLRGRLLPVPIAFVLSPHLVTPMVVFDGESRDEESVTVPFFHDGHVGEVRVDQHVARVAATRANPPVEVVSAAVGIVKVELFDKWADPVDSPTTVEVDAA